jgi:hypothetical protein
LHSPKKNAIRPFFALISHFSVILKSIFIVFDVFDSIFGVFSAFSVCFWKKKFLFPIGFSNRFSNRFSIVFDRFSIDFLSFLSFSPFFYRFSIVFAVFAVFRIFFWCFLKKKKKKNHFFQSHFYIAFPIVCQPFSIVFRSFSVVFWSFFNHFLRFSLFFPCFLRYFCLYLPIFAYFCFFFFPQRPSGGPGDRRFRARAKHKRAALAQEARRRLPAGQGNAVRAVWRVAVAGWQWHHSTEEIGAVRMVVVWEWQWQYWPRYAHYILARD